jgi:hypothetical protein
MFTRRFPLTLTATLGAASLSTAAWAQMAPVPPPVEAAPVEVSLGVSINALASDLNARPACAALGDPCTHVQSSDWGGFGLDLGVAGAVARHLALTGAATVAEYNWDSPESVRANRTSASIVRAFLAGPTWRSSFTRPRGVNNESDRMFGEVLVGVEGSTIAPPHRVIQASVGVDSHGLLPSSPSHSVTVRLEVGYRASPGLSHPETGLRFFIGAVIGRTSSPRRRAKPSGRRSRRGY